MPCEEIDSSHARTFETFPWYIRAGPLGVWFEPNCDYHGLDCPDQSRHSHMQAARPSRAVDYLGIIADRAPNILCLLTEQLDALMHRLKSARTSCQIPCNQRSYSHAPPVGSMVPWPVT